MKESIITVIFLGDGLIFLEELEKDVIMMISQSDHERTSPEAVIGEVHSFVNDHANGVQAASSCSQVQNSELLLGLWVFLDQLIVQQQLDAFMMLPDRRIMKSWKPFFPFEVYIVRIFRLLQDVFDNVVAPVLSS